MFEIDDRENVVFRWRLVEASLKMILVMCSRLVSDLECVFCEKAMLVDAIGWRTQVVSYASNLSLF